MGTEAETSNAGSGHRLAENARLLYYVGLGAVLTTGFYFGLTARVDDPLHLYLGLAIFGLATIPALVWAKVGGRSLPLFEVLMLTTANTFAIPLLSGHDQLMIYREDTVTTAAFAVVLYQILAIAAYFALRGRPGRAPFFTHDAISDRINRYIGYGLMLTTVYTCVSTFTELIPYDLAGVFRAVFYGIGLVAVFVQARRWGQGVLSRREQTYFLVNFLVQIVVLFSTLFLVGGISLTVLAVVGFVSGSRRLPLVVVLAALIVTALLHNGKSAMRTRYWHPDGEHVQPGLADLPQFFSEWIQDGLRPSSKDDTDMELTSKLVERTSLMHILCLVVARSPTPLPFLDGETYSDIPGQFVPRLFWPDKPLGHISTYTLSIYYGLQRPEDTLKTTIGFGMVAEAYANFGLFGVAILGVVLGTFYKKVHTLCAESPLLSYAGIFQIVLLAWSFQTEAPMSMWLSSMFQACVAVMGVPFIVRHIAG